MAYRRFPALGCRCFFHLVDLACLRASEFGNIFALALKRFAAGMGRRVLRVVVDFKTDADLPARRRHYEVQLSWYIYALSSITRTAARGVLLGL